MSDIDGLPLAGTTVAVVGAGMAGLTAARKLVRAGAAVTVFERHAEPGGRLGYFTPGAVNADEGAQYFTAREPAFKAWVARAKAEGAVAVWNPRGKDADEEWLVGTPQMADLLRSMAEGFSIRTGAEVTGLKAGPDGCELTLSGGEAAQRFDRVVLAIPAGRAAVLLAPLGSAFDAIASARLRPCWTITADFGVEAAVELDILRDIGPFRWAARAASRPARNGFGWVAQASLDWSEAHLDDHPDAVAATLTAALAEALAVPSGEARAHVRLWREAFTTAAVGTPFLITGDGRVGCCGDWLIAPRLEAAWLSACGLADAMLALSRTTPA